MEHESTYTVLIQDHKFTLSKSQIQFDSPNYFTTCFLGDFREASTRSVQISRNPAMFPLIQEYLCGYMVLPMNEDTIPKGMTLTQAIYNLRTDAMFFQLEGLVRQCNTYLKPVKKGLPASHRYLLVGWQVCKDEPVDILSLDPEDIEKHLPNPKELGWHLYITGQELDRIAFKDLVMREEFTKDGVGGISALTNVTSVVDRILPKDGRRRWVIGVQLRRFVDRYEGGKEEGEEDSGDEGFEDSDEEATEEQEEESDEENEGEDDEEQDTMFDGFEGEIIVVMLEE